MKRKIIIILFILIAITLSLSSCSEEETIKIGFIGTLTENTFGFYMRNMVQFVVEEINNSGGIKGKQIELIIKDDENNPEIARKRFQELIDEDVVAVIGHPTSSMSEASLPLANKNKMLMISPTASSNRFGNKDDYFISITHLSKYTSQNYASYTYNKLGISRVAIIYDLSNKSYTEDWYFNYKEKFNSLNGEIVTTVTYNAKEEDIDYISLIDELIKDNPRAVAIVSDPLDTAKLTQQLAKVNFSGAVFSSSWALTSDFIKNAGKSSEGVIFFNPIDSNSDRKIFQEVKEKYEKTFNEEIDLISMYAYDVIMVLKEAITKAKNYKDSEELKQLIINKKYEGIFDDFYINEYGESQRDLFQIKVINSEFTKVE